MHLLQGHMNAQELRAQRKKELKRIVDADLAGLMPYEAILKEWSSIADRLINHALETILKEIDVPPKFCVLGLGKLGGMELNYSSDIDIIYIYDGDIETAVKIANRLNRMLGDVTDDGFVFRVDTNLRPLGKQGPMVNTVDALERYYEVTGQEWERQALVRARPVAGDMALGEEFIERVRPFVFRRSLDVGALKKIRATKMALERSAEAEGWRNIKLGPGGIREVEFIVQALQLLNGGRIRKLMTTNTFEALRVLLDNGLINRTKHDELLSAYLLLRRTENMLQAKDDRQTHTLPRSDEELAELATRLGYSSGKILVTDLDGARKKVQAHFSDLFDTNFEKMEIKDAMEANIETCKSKEEIIDSLPWFKSHISKRIQEMDLSGKLGTDEISERLTFLAENILSESLKLAKEASYAKYGAARISDGTSAEMVILGMGKLGTYEMDYGSDLDLVFIYSGDGETDGKKKIGNHEYFTKIAQSVLSMITLPTRYGRTYNIDTELRPSGNQGALVTSIEAFLRYHKREASFWERQALIRSRVVAGDITLGNKVTELLDDLVFGTPLPFDVKAQIDSLREKAVKERPSDTVKIDIKRGRGGLADIESIVHYMQLQNAQKDHRLKERRLCRAIDTLFDLEMMTEDEHKTLKDALELFRKILSRTRLFASYGTGIIDTGSEQFQAVSESLGFNEKNALINRIETLMMDVGKIYFTRLGTHALRHLDT